MKPKWKTTRVMPAPTGTSLIRSAASTRGAGVMGAYGGENGGALHDALEAEHADRNEPHEHCRPEDPADELRSLALDQEQTDKDRDGDRNDHRRKCGRVDLQTFDGAGSRHA